MTSYGGADRSYFWGGGIPPFSEKEINLDFEGGVIINKAQTNVVAAQDTIDAQVLAGMPYGRNATEANKPTLEFPIMHLRALNQLPDIEKNKLYQAAYTKLLNALPEEVKQQLSELKQSGALTKNSVYQALEETLSFVATTLVWKEAISSAQKRPLTQYLSMTETAFFNFIADSEKVIREGVFYLKKMGPNHVEHDTLLKFLKEFSKLLKQLKRSHKEKEGQKEKKEKNKEENLKNVTTKIVNQIATLNCHYKNKKQTKTLQMLGSYFQAAETLSLASTLKGGASPVFCAFALAKIGSLQGTSQTFVVGKTLNRSLNFLSIHQD